MTPRRSTTATTTPDGRATCTACGVRFDLDPVRGDCPLCGVHDDAWVDPSRLDPETRMTGYVVGVAILNILLLALVSAALLG